MPEFYMIFDNLYFIFREKYFFPIFFFWGGAFAPSPTLISCSMLVTL